MIEYVEGSDSSAAQTRALASALHGRHFDMYGLGFAARSVARWFYWLPADLLRFGAGQASNFIGLPHSTARRVRTDEMARGVVSLYPRRVYDTVITGAPSGGVSHIGSILDAPFLTTHFLLCFRDSRSVDDIYTTLARSRRLAGRIVENNPDLHVVAHYDPLHDRPVLFFINHLRAKLTGVPASYSSFFEGRLSDEGTIVLIRCNYRWLQYRIKPRVSLQVGGLGGVPDREYIEGSDRLKRYRISQGSVFPGDGGWRLRGGRYPLVSMPESEWGGMPEYDESVREYAAANGFRLLELTADHPEKFSELAFHLHREASVRDGAAPRFMLADCFNQLDPLANLRSRLLPLWLPYYGERSFSYAERMLKLVPPEVTVLLTMHPSLADPFDMVPLERWMELMTRERNPVLLGVDPARFPRDISYALDFGRQLRDFCGRHPDPVRARLGADDLAAAAAGIGIDVCWR